MSREQKKSVEPLKPYYFSTSTSTPPRGSSSTDVLGATPGLSTASTSAPETPGCSDDLRKQSFSLPGYGSAPDLAFSQPVEAEVKRRVQTTAPVILTPPQSPKHRLGSQVPVKKATPPPQSLSSNTSSADDKSREVSETLSSQRSSEAYSQVGESPVEPVRLSVSNESDDSQNSNSAPFFVSTVALNRTRSSKDSDIDTFRPIRKEKQKEITFGWKFNCFNALVSIGTGFIFSELSAQRAEGDILWAIVFSQSSFLMNAPMSFLFNEDAVKALIHARKYGDRKDKIYMAVASILGLSAILPTLKFSIDAVAKTVPDSLHVIAYGILPANSFVTRTVGAKGIFDRITNGAIEMKRRRQHPYKIYYQLLDDLNNTQSRIGDFSVVRKNNESTQDWYNRFTVEFYEKLEKNGIKPGRTTSETAKAYGQFSLTSSALALCFYIMTPLFLAMSEAGWNDLQDVSWADTVLSPLLGNEKPWGQHDSITCLSAFATLLFYLNSISLFFTTVLPLLTQLRTHIKESTVPWLQKYILKKASPDLLTNIILIVLLASYFVCEATPSGAAFSKEMQSAQNGTFFPANTTEAPFGDVDSRTFSHLPSTTFVFSLFAKYANEIALFIAGTLVNGRGSMPKLPIIYTALRVLLVKMQPCRPQSKPTEETSLLSAPLVKEPGEVAVNIPPASEKLDCKEFAKKLTEALKAKAKEWFDADGNLYVSATGQCEDRSTEEFVQIPSALLKEHRSNWSCRFLDERRRRKGMNPADDETRADDASYPLAGFR